MPTESTDTTVTEKPRSTTPARPPGIRRELHEDGVCVLWFDRAGSSANLFDRQTLAELDDCLGQIEKDSGITGVVLASAKKSIFIAGADLHAIEGLTMAQLEEYIAFGQKVFTLLFKHRAPT